MVPSATLFELGYWKSSVIVVLPSWYTHVIKGGDWIGCLSSGSKSSNKDMGNHDKKVDDHKGKYSGQTNKQTATLLI